MAYEAETKALNKAKIQLMYREDIVFYTVVCMSLEHIWDKAIPTACTNGKQIRYNPGFFMKQSPAQQLGLMLHETEHVVYQHMLRMGDRDHEKWNYAADHVINISLLDSGFELPDGGLWDFQYRGLSTEQVYDLIPDPPKGYTMDVVMASGGDGGSVEGQGAGATATLREDINDILIRAAIQSKAAGEDPGNIPAEVRAYLDKLMNPHLPWYRILERYCFSTVKSDSTFRKPNRRFFPDMLLPSKHSESLDCVGVMLDMSGSVSDKQSTHFASEVHGIVRRLNPRLLKLGQFDTSIKSVTDITSVADLTKVEYHGRGGTKILPVLEWINENKPDVAIIFTDGYFTMPAIKPASPVIWVIHSNPTWKAPFGKVIYYDIPQQ